jgi:Tfp pilus assembly protein FimT
VSLVRVMKNAQTKKNKSGFSIIELFIVISIFVTFAFFSVPVYSGIVSSVQLNEQTSEIIQVVRLARAHSVSRFHNKNWGVYFEINDEEEDPDRIIFYQGRTYGTRVTPFDRVLVVKPPLNLSTTLQDNEVNFEKGLGTPNTMGKVVISHPVKGARVISVYARGARRQ